MMEIGKFYRVTYTRKNKEHTFIGMYEGVETSFANCIECDACYKEGHKRVHQFNIPYNETGSIEEMTADLDDLLYRTSYFGTTCIKKCKLEEVK